MLLHHIFEKQALQTPSALAVKSDAREYSYQQLNEAANQVANYLIQCGCKNGDFIGLYFKRSQLPIVAMLGVLKAGCAYIPIDRSFPEERINHIIKDASVGIILTQQSLFEELPSNSNTKYIDITATEITTQPVTAAYLKQVTATPANLTYLIYTSGSTGKPKGVMATHANVVHFVNSFAKVCMLTPKDRLFNGFAYSFDGSVEEIWMAFSCGASLIVANDEAAKLASEAVKLINSEQITFLSTVPTMLKLMGEAMPSLNLIILSGEPCTTYLVDIWADRCRLLNVYGPTETTVNTTCWLCKKGVPIVIGNPIPDYPVYIFNKKMEPTKIGEKGELYIGGNGVAEGYLNQPELSAQTFRKDIIEGKTLYKTGDLVSYTTTGEIMFHGRIDSQVKVRGFRIELSEIEHVIAEFEAVESVVVDTVSPLNMTEIAAYIVSKDKANPFDSDALLKYIQKRLPMYMTPSYLEVLDEMPLLTSGKVNRKELPKDVSPWLLNDRELVAPRSTTEIKVTEIWKTVLKPLTISITDDFFNDLRGDSLFAAIVATEMRDKGMEIAIRDIYKARTIEKLSVIVDELAKNRDTAENKETTDTSKASKYANIVKGLQFIAQYLIYGFMLIPFLLSGIVYLETGSSVQSIAYSLLFSYPLMLLMSIAAKWIIIGRFKAGDYPLYGFYFFRWWLVDRLTHIAMPQLLAGSPLMSLYYRAMGAKIGKRCVIDTHLTSAWDLIRIRDDSSIGNETQLMGSIIEHKTLKLGTIEIGKNCYVGIHSCLGINSGMGNNAHLGDISILNNSERLLAYAHRQGSPAIETEILTPKGDTYKQREWIWRILHILAIYMIQLFLVLAALPSSYLIYCGLDAASMPEKLLLFTLAAPLFVVSFCMLSVCVHRTLMVGLKAGVYKVASITFLRKWIADSITRLSVQILKPLYTTIYLPGWLRLLGAKIGKHAEISTVSQISPELMEIGDESFFADGSIIGGRQFYGGYMKVSKTRIGSRSFIGNSAILPVGTNIGDGCLIGVLSVPPVKTGTIPDGTDWLGSPSFNLPLRQKVEGFSDEQVYKPTIKLYILRYIIDTVRILVPTVLEIISIVCMFYGVLFLITNALWFLIPIAFILLSIANVVVVILFKWLFMGKIPATIKPLWCCFVWRNEAVNGAYESVMTNALGGLVGTPFLAPFLRLLGCKIGKDVYMGSMLMSEFDLVHIGDDVTINSGVVIQNHLFEDRIMKASTLEIRENCSIGNMSIVLYDAVIEPNTRLESLSMVMKNEKLPSNSVWRGIPCMRV